MAGDAVSAGLSTAAGAPFPKQDAIGQHLDATCVERGRIGVHVSEQDVGGHACASLAAHVGRCPFERRTPRAQNSGRGAGRVVIAQWVQGALGSRNAGAVGSTVTACEPPGPAWDSIRAREAASRSEKRLAHADLSKEGMARKCSPGTR